VLLARPPTNHRHCAPTQPASALRCTPTPTFHLPPTDRQCDPRAEPPSTNPHSGALSTLTAVQFNAFFPAWRFTFREPDSLILGATPGRTLFILGWRFMNSPG